MNAHEEHSPATHADLAPLPPLQLDTDSKQIRLLTLWPGKLSDPIVCSLRTASLEHNPVYGALSYVWGDPGARHYQIDRT